MTRNINFRRIQTHSRKPARDYSLLLLVHTKGLSEALVQVPAPSLGRKLEWRRQPQEMRTKPLSRLPEPQASRKTRRTNVLRHRIFPIFTSCPVFFFACCPCLWGYTYYCCEHLHLTNWCLFAPPSQLSSALLFLFAIRQFGLSISLDVVYKFLTNW